MANAVKNNKCKDPPKVLAVTSPTNQKANKTVMTIACIFIDLNGHCLMPQPPL